MIDLDAIRERDATQFEMYHRSCHDRRALLRYVDELRAAAGKVSCGLCHDMREDCPACEELRKLTGERA